MGMGKMKRKNLMAKPPKQTAVTPMEKYLVLASENYLYATKNCGEYDTLAQAQTQMAAMLDPSEAFHLAWIVKTFDRGSRA